MPHPLASLLAFPIWYQRRKTDSSFTVSGFDVPYREQVTDEVLELDGVLLVRMGRCSAMQVKLDRECVMVRVVPMVEATRLDSDAPWQAASERQIESWVRSAGAVWRWLLSKGYRTATVTAAVEAAGPMRS